MNEEKPTYYAIIPAEVRYDDRLSSSQKLMYGEITALSSKTGECWPTNKYFADLYNVEIPTVSNWINKLKKLGYIEVELIYNGKNVEKRIIKLNATLIPINKNVNSPINKNVNSPINKNVKDNNININNINTNTCSTKESFEEEIKDRLKASTALTDITIRWLHETLLVHTTYEINHTHFSKQLDFLIEVGTTDINKAISLISKAIETKMFDLKTCFNKYKNNFSKSYNPKHPSQQSVISTTNVVEQATKEEEFKTQQTKEELLEKLKQYKGEINND